VVDDNFDKFQHFSTQGYCFVLKIHINVAKDTLQFSGILSSTTLYAGMYGLGEGGNTFEDINRAISTELRIHQRAICF